MSSMVSSAMYGLTAAAPKPMSSAMWWTSRASPVSMTRPTWVRVFSRTRWWWTAEVSSSDGMGAHSSVELRSERTMMLAPSAMASETRRRTSARARASASPPAWVGCAGPAGLAHLEQPVDGEGLEARASRRAR